MQEKINYLTKDLYNVCQSIIKKKYDFIIEVNKQKDIKLLQKTIPSLIGKTDKSPSVWPMILTAFKFSDISAIIGSIHQEEKYTIFYEVKDTLLLHFKRSL